MNNDKTGGAAFPLESDYGSQKGMTLRDYFAGQVIGQLEAFGADAIGTRVAISQSGQRGVRVWRKD